MNVTGSGASCAQRSNNPSDQTGWHGYCPCHRKLLRIAAQCTALANFVRPTCSTKTACTYTLTSQPACSASQAQLTIVALLSINVFAVAVDWPGPPRGVCMRDFLRFCAFRVPDMKNMEDIIKCMDAHVDELLPPCKEMVHNATAVLNGFHAACDASLTAQCPDAIGKTPATRKCLVQHLVDLDRGCLAEISELIQKKMARGGSGGDLRPLPRPMDGFSTGGIGSEEFDLEGDFSGPRAPSDIDWEQPGRFTGGFTPVHAALVGAIAAVLSMFVVKCLQRSCFRRRCPKFHHHPHPQPPPPPAPHAQREHIAMPLLAEPQAHKV